MRWSWLVSLVVAFAVAGCGGDDEESASERAQPARPTKSELAAAGLAARTFLQNTAPARCPELAAPSAVEFCRDYARTQTVAEPDLRIELVRARGGNSTVTFVAAGRAQGKVELRRPAARGKSRP